MREIHRSVVNCPTQRPVTRSFNAFFDLRLNKNGWVNNREAGDWRRHRTHYDITVFAGTANGMSLVATLSAVIRVFNGRLRAVVLALIVSAADVGPLIYSLCFELWFKVAPEDYYSRPDIVRYLVLVTASKGLIHLLGILVFSGMPSGDDADVNERTQLVTKDNTVDKTCDNKCDTSDEKTESEESNGKSQRKLSTYNGHCDELGIFDVVKKLQFHVIMWPAAVLIGLKFTSAKNLNLYLLSFKWMETSLPFTGAASLFCLFTLPLVAIISELGSPPFSRSLLLVGASIIAIICYITAIYYLDNIYILSLNVMFWTLSADIALALQPLLHIDEFGDQTFVINNGFLLAGMAVVMAVSQYWFGAFYRLNWIQDDMVCYGLECYMWTFVVGACITAICLVVILINTCRYYKRYNERDHEPARTDNSRWYRSLHFINACTVKSLI